MKTGGYIGDLYWLPIGYWPYGLRLVQIIEVLQLPACDHCTVIWVLYPVGGAQYHQIYVAKMLQVYDMNNSTITGNGIIQDQLKSVMKGLKRCLFKNNSLL